jgi:mannose-6-phosphate isomerase
MKQRPYKLKNEIQNYPWGTKDDDAYIPKLLGINADSGTHYAELWMGAYNNSSSTILMEDSEQSLSEFIDSDAASILGKKAAARFNNKLPFLFKVLSIAEPLSIQTHPNKEQAAFLHNAESFKFPDDNHKPEIVIAIDKFELLWGFKSVESIKKICNEYGKIIEFIGEEKFNNIFDKSNAKESSVLKEFYSVIVDKADSDKDNYKLLLENLKATLTGKTANKTESLFLKLYEQYDADLGMITMFFLNYIELNPGEALFTPPGTPHAYISGNVIECMANSDNVIRAGLTTKYVDLKNLLKVLNYEPSEANVIMPKKSKGYTEYRSKEYEFMVTKIDVTKNHKIKVRKGFPASIFLLIDGTVKMRWKGGEMDVNKGESVFLAANCPACFMESDNATGYLATVNM